MYQACSGGGGVGSGEGGGEGFSGGLVGGEGGDEGSEVGVEGLGLRGRLMVMRRGRETSVRCGKWEVGTEDGVDAYTGKKVGRKFGGDNEGENERYCFDKAR